MSLSQITARCHETFRAHCDTVPIDTEFLNALNASMPTRGRSILNSWLKFDGETDRTAISHQNEESGSSEAITQVSVES